MGLYDNIKGYILSYFFFLRVIDFTGIDFNRGVTFLLKLQSQTIFFTKIFGVLVSTRVLLLKTLKKNKKNKVKTILKKTEKFFQIKKTIEKKLKTFLPDKEE